MKQAILKFGGLSLVVFLLAGTSDVLAERLETESVSESDWEFELFIDGWLPKAPISIVHEDFEIDLPENLNTILDSLNFTTMLRFNAHKGPLGIFVNPIYYNGTYDKVKIKLPLEEVDGKLKEAVWYVDYGLSYEIGRWDIGKGESSRIVTLEPYAGFRFFHDNMTVEVEPGLIGDGFTEHITLSSNSPIIGLQSHMQLSDAWGFLLVGDYGGFGVNHMEESYQMAGYFDYTFSWKKFRSRAYFGYRFVHLDLEDDTTALNANIQGPLLGISFIF